MLVVVWFGLLESIQKSTGRLPRPSALLGLFRIVGLFHTLDAYYPYTKQFSAAKQSFNSLLDAFFSNFPPKFKKKITMYCFCSYMDILFMRMSERTRASNSALAFIHLT